MDFKFPKKVCCTVANSFSSPLPLELFKTTKKLNRNSTISIYFPLGKGLQKNSPNTRARPTKCFWEVFHYIKPTKRSIQEDQKDLVVGQKNTYVIPH